MALSNPSCTAHFDADGSTDTFPFDFPFMDTAHIVVLRRTSTGAEETLVLGTDYSLEGMGSPFGGTVILTSWPEEGAHLTILRVLPLTQPTRFRNQGAFYPEIHEQSADRILMALQQLNAQGERSLRLPRTVSGISAELPAPLPGHAITWREDGQGLDNGIPGVSISEVWDPLAATGTGQGAHRIGYRAPWGGPETTQNEVNARRISAFDGLTAAQRQDVTSRGRNLDCTAALQAVLDNAPAGAEVELENGDYLITAPLRIRRQIHLKGRGWGSRLVAASTMAVGATVYGTVSGTTLTLAEDNWGGTIVLGSTILGGGVTHGTKVLALLSGVANKAGATYSLDHSSTVASPTLMQIGGQDVIYVEPDSDVDTDNLAGYTFSRFAIICQGDYTSPSARNGICLSQNPTQSLSRLLVDRVSIRTLGGFSVCSDQVTQATIENSSLNSIACNVGGDTLRIVNNGIGNFNPAHPNIYVNCYAGANSMVISRNTVTGWGGREFVWVDYAGTISIHQNQFEDVLQPSIGVEGSAVRMVGRSDASIYNAVIRENNWNLMYRRIVIYSDWTVGLSIRKNNFPCYGGISAAFQATANTVALEWGVDNFTYASGSTSGSVQYTTSRNTLAEMPSYQAACTVDGSNHLTLTADVPGLDADAKLASKLWWVQGAGIAAGTYLVARISGTIGKAGSVYSLSTSPGALSARPIYVIPKVFADLGAGTMGIWKLLTLPSSGEVLPSASPAMGYSSYCKINDDTVCMAGGAAITNPTANKALTGAVLPGGFLPNNYAIMAASGKQVNGGTTTWAAQMVQVDYLGNVVILTPSTYLTAVSLEGLNYRHIPY